MAAFIVTRFDFRGPGHDARQRAGTYARALEQAAYLQQHLPDSALLVSEHHA